MPNQHYQQLKDSPTRYSRLLIHLLRLISIVVTVQIFLYLFKVEPLVYLFDLITGLTGALLFIVFLLDLHTRRHR